MVASGAENGVTGSLANSPDLEVGMADDSVVLVKNAKGRYVIVSALRASEMVARKDGSKIVSAETEEYQKGVELSSGGQGAGIRGDQVLRHTSEGLAAGGE